mgnify:CR=1 FL=1
MTFPELPEKVRILIVRFSYDGQERIEIGQWIARLAPILAVHPRVEHVFWSCPIGYPITCQRNAALDSAIRNGCHFVLMCDTDMIFDVHAKDGGIDYAHMPKMADQIPFMPAALEYALEHPGPCVIAAPYCAGPPSERVLVHRFVEYEQESPNAPTEGIRLEPFSREEAALKTGYEMVAALPTGLMLIDTRVCHVLKPPYFTYEYNGDAETGLIGTEDVVFSRNLYYLGVPQYCAWSSWSAHVKHRFVGRPRVYPKGAYPMGIQKTWERGILERSKATRPADAINEEAVRILADWKAREKAPDADPVLPLTDDELCDTGDVHHSE